MHTFLSLTRLIWIWPHAKAQWRKINFSFLTLSQAGFVSEFISDFWENFWRETSAAEFSSWKSGRLITSWYGWWSHLLIIPDSHTMGLEAAAAAFLFWTLTCHDETLPPPLLCIRWRCSPFIEKCSAGWFFINYLPGTELHDIRAFWIFRRDCFFAPVVVGRIAAKRGSSHWLSTWGARSGVECQQPDANIFCDQKPPRKYRNPRRRENWFLKTPHLSVLCNLSCSPVQHVAYLFPPGWNPPLTILFAIICKLIAYTSQLLLQLIKDLLPYSNDFRINLRCMTCAV